IYMEGLRKNRGKDFIEIIKNYEKPIVILKAGKTNRGNLAAISHTASMVGNYDVYRDVFRRFNIIEAKDFHEFMIYLKTAAYL
ncbi:MAG: CoA-binding protein, partial [Candidatus Aenigmatarchaeota archaeon]